MLSSIEHMISGTPVFAPSEGQREISMWIDGYDDIFSDFDPRPYSERNISDDFLDETKKICRENEFEIRQFVLLVPEDARYAAAEVTIITRLNEHFRTHYKYLNAQLVNDRKKGIITLVIGAVLMLLASYISSLQSNRLDLNMLFVILNPAGWYVSWIGLDIIFKTEPLKIEDLKFNGKLRRCKILFRSIPD